MIVFDRRAGTLTHVGSSEPFARGIWSGHGRYHNDPAFEYFKSEGPIPAGLYDIGPLEAHHPGLGPEVMALKPARGTEVFGRSGFFMHGDKAGDVDWSASHGCVIAPHNVRVLVNAMVDRRLKVV